MKTLLWLDDLRDPTDDFWHHFITKNFGNFDKYIWVHNFNSFIQYIQSNPMPDLICFDHDLGDSDTKTGFDCAWWLVNYCMDNSVLLPKFYSQSMNPVGKEKIMSLLLNFIIHGQNI